MHERKSVVAGGFGLPAGGARVDAPPVLRLAGLPVSALLEMRLERSFELAQEIARLGEWLDGEAGELSDALFAEIGALTGDSRKPQVVGLRRALHQGRRPRAREWNAGVEDALSAGVAGRVREWLARSQVRERLAADLPEILAADVRAAEDRMRGVAAEPRFRRALSQASPSLFAELTKWLQDDAHRPRAQTMTRLAKYVSRAAAKTSPYSTFTISGVGEWGDADRLDGLSRYGGVLDLDGYLIKSITRTLSAQPALRATLTVRANPSAIVQGDTVTFVGVPPQESIITVPCSPAVRECLRLVAEHPDRTLAVLAGSLAPGAEDRALPFLEKLVSAGLLSLEPPLSDQAGDPLAELSAWVAAAGDQQLMDVVEVLDRLRHELGQDVPVEDVEAHRARQDRLRAAIGRVIDRLGLPFPPVDELGKVIFHENAVFYGPPVTRSIDKWRPALDDLDTVRRWLAAFDPALPLRLALGTYCRERFGAGAAVSYLSLFRAVHEEVARQGEHSPAASEVVRYLRASPLPDTTALAASPLPRLRALAAIQEEARLTVLGEADQDGVVRTPTETLRRMIDRWPAWVSAPDSLGCYVQPIERREGLSLALNVAHSGFGRGRSRLARLVSRAGGTLPPDDAWLRPRPGTVYAELSGSFSSTLNVRAPMMAYEIDYPHTVTRRPGSERLPLSDLMVAHDSESDLVRVVSSRLGEQVVPLHLGMMADVLLPSVAQLLTWAFGATYYTHPSFSPLAVSPHRPSPDAITKHERVETGRIVLRRARWTVPAGLVPVRQAAEPDADFLVRLVEWLRGHGIPTRAYLRMWADGLWEEESADNRMGKWVMDKSRKPIYLDFSNWHLLGVLERMMRKPGPYLVFEEALPAPEDYREPAVAEYLVEISDRN
ncbi:lantibiotic dehydratase [Nonomuraea sp. K274]|uniref:Lantibiotic dehydratase n=1 Tax=Nonomuraea cypriaca TaxID=1187855 RepID=A0A931F1Z8_9ACTN|nr:lantibiotic dehydratase [Nonomuraea cypriaca]MBF8191030.1 lantibiotic dehydratase [Nonomuraea cypriaca]